MARRNAARYDVAGRITFLRGDLLAPLDTPVHLIVANLPYVSEDEYAALPDGIRLYEPREALVAGADGLDALGALLEAVRTGEHLPGDGVLLLEIGAGQGKAVSALAARAFPRARVAVLPDYSRRDRVVCVEWSL